MERTSLIKISKILRVLVIISLVALALSCVYYKFDDCNKCKFDYDGEKLNTREFMSVYSDECFSYNPNLENVGMHKGEESS